MLWGIFFHVAQKCPTQNSSEDYKSPSPRTPAGSPSISPGSSCCCGLEHHPAGRRSASSQPPGPSKVSQHPPGLWCTPQSRFSGLLGKREGITLPALETTLRVIMVAGNLVAMAIGTSLGSVPPVVSGADLLILCAIIFIGEDFVILASSFLAFSASVALVARHDLPPLSLYKIWCEGLSSSFFTMCTQRSQSPWQWTSCNCQGLFDEDLKVFRQHSALGITAPHVNFSANFKIIKGSLRQQYAHPISSSCHKSCFFWCCGTAVSLFSSPCTRSIDNHGSSLLLLVHSSCDVAVICCIESSRK